MLRLQTSFPFYLTSPEIFFTLNGSHLGTGFKMAIAEFNDEFYPCISFSHIGWKVETNFGKKYFQYNMQSLYSNIAWSSIEKSKGIELSGQNLNAKMRINRLSRQLSSEMLIVGNIEAGLVAANNILKPSVSTPGYFEIKITDVQDNQPS